jgi:hypothetical protein
MDFSTGGWWIIDDTGFPKKGHHSVGVTRQYCGVLGKQDNCQVAVNVSLACDEGSLPVAWQLYLPHVWAEDAVRRRKAGIPEDIAFASKPQIFLQQMRDLLCAGAPRYCVLADAGYGIDYAFRQGMTDQGLSYMVGITSAVVVWPPGGQIDRLEHITHQRRGGGVLLENRPHRQLTLLLPHDQGRGKVGQHGSFAHDARVGAQGAGHDQQTQRCRQAACDVSKHGYPAEI